MTQNQSGPRLAEIFSSYYEEVLAFAARRVGRNEAEDVAAEVFAIAVRRADEIDWTTARAWLYGIARGVLANRWRTVQRRQRLVHPHGHIHRNDVGASGRNRRPARRGS